MKKKHLSQLYILIKEGTYSISKLTFVSANQK